MAAAASEIPQRFPSRFRNPAENPDLFLKLADALFIRRKLSEEEIARYGTYLWVGDPLADRVAKKFDEIGIERAMTMLNAALSGHVPGDAPEALRELIAVTHQDPPWLDRSLLEEGAKLAQRSGPLGEYVLSCVSLMGGYRSAAANKPIAFTGQLEYMASRRLAETAKFGYDVTRTNAMGPGKQGFNAALKVRMVHAHVRLMLDRSPKWRHADWGLPINQADMLATNILFSSVYLTGLRILGLQISDRESQGVMHLWRYIGWLMGIDEALLPEDEEQGMRMAWLAGVTQPPADEDSRRLGQALMNVPLERATTPVEKIFAWFEMQLRSGFTRMVLGDRAGDDLGLPNTPLKYAIFITTPAIFAFETVRRVIPGATEFAVRLGDSWQRRMVEKPLGGKMPAFVPPQELRRN